jgi:hypothetical protein
MRLLYETNAGKRHMKTNDKDLVGRNRRIRLRVAAAISLSSSTSRWMSGLCSDTCVYRKPRFGSNGDEIHQGSGVNERFRSDESDEKSAHPCAKTDAF